MKKLFLILFLVSCGEAPIDDTNTTSGTAVATNNAAVATNNATVRPKPTQTNNGEKNSESGKELYVRYCSACHGMDAKGTAIWEPSIEGYSPIESIVLDGRGDMDAIKITKKQNAKIQSYLLTLAKPNEELDGAGLYARYCASCHGADAKGAEKWMGSIEGYEPIRKIVLDGRGDMEAVAITEMQSDMIQEWLLSLQPPLGEATGQEVYTRLCKGCHGEKGVGAEKGMQLRYDDIEYSRFWIRKGRAATGSYTSAMPDYPADMISDKQIDEMFAMIDSEPHPTEGKDLFGQYCGNCHGPKGNGGPSGKNVRFFKTFKYEKEIRKGIGGTNYGARRDYMSKWTAEQISVEEINAMKAFARF